MNEESDSEVGSDELDAMEQEIDEVQLDQHGQWVDDDDDVDSGLESVPEEIVPVPVGHSVTCMCDDGKGGKNPARGIVVVAMGESFTEPQEGPEGKGKGKGKGKQRRDKTIKLKDDEYVVEFEEGVSIMVLKAVDYVVSQNAHELIQLDLTRRVCTGRRSGFPKGQGPQKQARGCEVDLHQGP